MPQKPKTAQNFDPKKVNKRQNNTPFGYGHNSSLEKAGELFKPSKDS